MAQSVKYLPHKHDLSSDPRSHGKADVAVVHICKPSAGRLEADEAHQPVQPVGELHTQVSLLSREKKKKMPRVNL